MSFKEENNKSKIKKIEEIEINSPINIPNLSSKSNEIPKLDCSNIEEQNKNIKISCSRFGNSRDLEKEKKDSNYSIKEICDEMSKEEKIIAENKW